MRRRKTRQTLAKRIASAPTLQDAFALAWRGAAGPPTIIQRLVRSWTVIRWLRSVKASRRKDWEAARDALTSYAPSVEADTLNFIIHAMVRNRPQDLHDLAVEMEQVNKAGPFEPDMKRCLLLAAMGPGKAPNIYRLAKQAEADDLETSDRELRRIYRDLRRLGTPPDK